MLPYLASLLKRCRIPEKPVNPSLLDALLPFLLCALRFKLTFALSFFKFGLPLNAPLILMQSVFAILDLSSQDRLDRDLPHAHFEPLSVLILPES
jgi:hypothetical protein